MLIPRGVDEWRKLKVSLIQKTPIGLDFQGHAIIDVLIHLEDIVNQFTFLGKGSI